MKYAKEITAGCAAGLAIAAALSWQQWREQEAVFIEAARIQAHALARLAASQQRQHGAVALPPESDPWGAPYSVSGTRVCSHGPDQRPETPDDICAP